MANTFSSAEKFPSINFCTITDKDNGAIGTAANTVDFYQGAMVAQTTGSKTLTLPSPTTDAPTVFFVVNTGSVAFTMLQKTVYPGTCLTCIYTNVSVPNIGKTWVAAGASATITTTTSTTV